MAKLTDKQKKEHKGTLNLKPFKKGKSGNPKGRPKKEVCIPDILHKLLSKPCTQDKKKTNLEKICLVAIEQATSGDKDARNWVADRTEGKAVERVLKQEVKDEIVIE